MSVESASSNFYFLNKVITSLWDGLRAYSILSGLYLFAKASNYLSFNYLVFMIFEILTNYSWNNVLISI